MRFESVYGRWSCNWQGEVCNFAGSLRTRAMFNLIVRAWWKFICLWVQLFVGVNTCKFRGIKKCLCVTSKSPSITFQNPVKIHKPSCNRIPSWKELSKRFHHTLSAAHIRELKCSLCGGTCAVIWASVNDKHHRVVLLIRGKPYLLGGKTNRALFRQAQNTPLPGKYLARMCFLKDLLTRFLDLG